MLRLSIFYILVGGLLQGVWGPLWAQQAVSFNSEHATKIFKHVKLHRAAGAEKLLAVFDLDDTLIDTRPRTAAILKKCFETHLDRHQQKAFPQIADIPIDRIEYVMDETFKNVLSRKQLRNDEYREVLEAISECWDTKFFTKKYVKKDKAFEGARELLWYLQSLDVEVFYVSARPEYLRNSTLECLKSFDFPFYLDDGVNLALKPQKEVQATPLWKKNFVSRYLNEGYKLVTVFENDPENMDVLRALDHPNDNKASGAPFFFVDSIREHLGQYPQMKKEEGKPEIFVLSDLGRESTHEFCETYLGPDKLEI